MEQNIKDWLKGIGLILIISLIAGSIGYSIGWDKANYYYNECEDDLGVCFDNFDDMIDTCNNWKDLYYKCNDDRTGCSDDINDWIDLYDMCDSNRDYWQSAYYRCMK